MTFRRGGKSLSLLAIALAAGLLMGACGSDDGDDDDAAGEPAQQLAAPAAVTVTATEFEFETDVESVPAGWVSINFEIPADAKEPHVVQIDKLEEGVTFEDYEKAWKEEDRPPATSAGGAAGALGLEPGESQRVLVNLEEGEYAFICHVHGHHERGMMAPFTVTASEGETEEPTGDAEIKTVDYDFVMPEGFTGQGTFKVTNEGPQPHELSFVKLDATLAELEEFMAKPNPFDADPPGGEEGLVEAGGVAAIEAGAVQYIDLDLEPGVYLMACFVPDAKKRQPHAFLGMAKPIEIK